MTSAINSFFVRVTVSLPSFLELFSPTVGWRCEAKLARSSNCNSGPINDCRLCLRCAEIEHQMQCTQRWGNDYEGCMFITLKWLLSCIHYSEHS